MRTLKSQMLLVAIWTGVAQSFVIPSISHKAKSGSLMMALKENDDDGNVFDRRSFFTSTAGLLTVGFVVPHNDAGAAMPGEDYSNDWIQTLKARSDAKREEYDKAARSGKISWEKLNSKTFNALYDKPKFVGVKRADGTYQMVTPSQYDILKGENKIIEVFETKIDEDGNRVPDYKAGLIKKFAPGVDEAQVLDFVNGVEKKPVVIETPPVTTEGSETADETPAEPASEPAAEPSA